MYVLFQLITGRSTQFFVMFVNRIQNKIQNSAEFIEVQNKDLNVTD
jgi:hypothetical protein